MGYFGANQLRRMNNIEQYNDRSNLQEEICFMSE